ncbi:MAG: hypothetical protein LCH51_16990 [Bacteroidetes bacterium]|nr:hypothetical protein [Bacteroidota bacterium]
MIKPLLVAATLLLGSQLSAQEPELPAQRDPLRNLAINPNDNNRINPDKNLRINPKQNWNINPLLNDKINPAKNKLLDPKINKEFSPIANHSINPMFNFTLHPLSNNQWTGQYIFNKDGQMVGYLVDATQFIKLDFDQKGNWKGYLVKTSTNTYLYYNLQDEWTKGFYCEDSMVGYNIFDGQAEWTGLYAK